MKTDNCEHPNFTSTVRVLRLLNPHNNKIDFVTEIQIECFVCHQPFEFLGVPAGAIVKGVAVSPDRRELRIGLEPSKPLPNEKKGVES